MEEFETEELGVLAEELDRMLKLAYFAEREKFEPSEIAKRTKQLIASIEDSFRTVNVAGLYGVELEMEVIDDTLWAHFSGKGIKRSLEIPLPYINSKRLELIGRKDVVRVMCDFWIEQKQRRMHYHEIIETLLCGNVNDIIPSRFADISLIPRIVRAFGSNSASFIISNIQNLVNGISNVMPLHETDMNSWAMNRRIVVIDPVFELISDPNRRLDYQVEKNRVYYEKFGWTAIGLSDGVLADKNYLLATDLRKLTPFGMYHNPQRNLYSTLGMKGDELPRIRTKSMQALIDKKITRGGWNLNTAILDTPLNFEDQILVDNRLKGLFHKVERRFVIYGRKVNVKPGEEVKFDEVLGYSDDGHSVRNNLKCEEARVIGVRRDFAELGGERVPIVVVKIRGKRFLKDGSKFSNLHGNKGVIKFLDLGHTISPKTGEETPIDVMISATSINKRKNFGQIFEALLNVARPGNDPIVLDDELVMNRDSVKKSLARVGYPEDGACMISTYCGDFAAVVGRMFWGVTKDPEDQLWEDERTEVMNNRELRTSGLKFSHVEIKALTTRFGPGNPILAEILSYSQGVEILQDELRIMRSAAGQLDPKYPVVDVRDVRCVDTSKGLFHNLADIKGTVVDDEYMPEGFVLRLPFYVQALVSRQDKENFVFGFPQPVDASECIEYRYNTIFIPNALVRRCWHHGSGKWGLSVIGAWVNSIVRQCHRYMSYGNSSDAMIVMNSITKYFTGVSKMMGSKRGELSTYGMAVRYPFSSRATAALSDSLPPNTVEIHREMAKTLKVKTGDVVLAERFPCLGFVSIRPQWVKVTDDPQCKYVIRVSGNSLISMTLDFDGDTLFLASFHNPRSIEMLKKEMVEPNQLCEDAINRINATKVPAIKEMSFDDFAICEFPKPTNDEHAEMVRKATGVKSHTGPVIALAYNLMRIVEANVPYTAKQEHVHLELLLDFLGNTVFKQKHGIKSLQEEATDAICLADVDQMVALGFERAPSELLCDLIRKEAASLRIWDLKKFHDRAKEKGGSKIINFIVRKKNRVYFATRSKMGPFNLLDHLADAPRDLPSFLLFHVLRTEREKIDVKLERLRSERMKIKDVLMTTRMKEVYETLSGIIDTILSPKIIAAKAA